MRERPCFEFEREKERRGGRGAFFLFFWGGGHHRLKEKLVQTPPFSPSREALGCLFSTLSRSQMRELRIKEDALWRDAPWAAACAASEKRFNIPERSRKSGCFFPSSLFFIFFSRRLKKKVEKTSFEVISSFVAAFSRAFEPFLLRSKPRATPPCSRVEEPALRLDAEPPCRAAFARRRRSLRQLDC